MVTGQLKPKKVLTIQNKGISLKIGTPEIFLDNFNSIRFIGLFLGEKFKLGSIREQKFGRGPMVRG